MSSIKTIRKYVLYNLVIKIYKGIFTFVGSTATIRIHARSRKASSKTKVATELGHGEKRLAMGKKVWGS